MYKQPSVPCKTMLQPSQNLQPWCEIPASGFPASVMMDKIVEATKSGTVTVRRPVEDLGPLGIDGGLGGMTFDHFDLFIFSRSY